jgi:hypothetical protein
MRSTSCLVRALVVALVVSAWSCGRITLRPEGEDAGGDAAQACKGLDEAHCAARPGCARGSCPICIGGASAFAGCYDPALEGGPPCPAIACAPCAGLDQLTCAARTDCQVNTCLGCAGPVFTHCAQPGDPSLPCPAYACPAPPPCSQVTTLDACEARSDCHSVFVDPGICDCIAVGCCAHFSACADGDRARCAAPATLACKAPTPFCESPAYVVAYTNVCYEGCVQSKDCAL